MDDKTTGWILTLASLLGIVAYYYLLFLSEWSSLTVKVSAFLAVAGILLILTWIGYTMATTPPPLPLEELEIKEDEQVVAVKS